MNIWNYWSDVLRQDAQALRCYFHPDALINWHNTNEQFTVEEFIRANCEYPGDWEGEIEQIFFSGNTVITALHVYSRDETEHFHVISFLHLEEENIRSVDEYWGNDVPVPQWRKDMKISRPIAAKNNNLD